MEGNDPPTRTAKMSKTEWQKVVDVLLKGGHIGRSSEDTAVLLDFCAHDSLLRQFPRESHVDFSKRMTLRKFDEGDVLFHQGEKVNATSCFYVLISGELDVYINKTFEDDREDTEENYQDWCRAQGLDCNQHLGAKVATLPELSTFGENLVGNERSATIKACKPSYCVTVLLSMFRKHTKKYSDTIIRNNYIQSVLTKPPVGRTDAECLYCSDFLLQIRFFKKLPSSVRKDIAKSLQYSKVRAHALVETEGLESDCIRIILSGRFALYSSSGATCPSTFQRLTACVTHRSMSESSHSTSSGEEEHHHALHGENAIVGGDHHTDSDTDSNDNAHGRNVGEQYGEYITTLVCGDSFGHHALSEIIGVKAVASVIAEEESEVLSLSHSHYEAILKGYEADLQFSLGSAMKALRTVPKRRTKEQSHLLEEFLLANPLKGFFDQFPPILREQLAEVIKLKHVEKHWTVCKDGDPVRYFYIVLSGRVAVYHRTPELLRKGNVLNQEGRFLHLRDVSSPSIQQELDRTYIGGDTFGHEALVSEPPLQTHATTAVCLDAADLILLPKRYFLHVLKPVIDIESISFRCGSCKAALLETTERRSLFDLDELAGYCHSKFRFFRALSVNTTKEIVQHCEHIKLPPRSHVVLEGSQGGRAFVVIKGGCMVFAKGETINAGLGNRNTVLRSYPNVKAMKRRFGVLVARIGVGDSFGEQAMANTLVEGSTGDEAQSTTTLRTASVLSESDCHLLAITHENYHRFVHREHGAFVRVNICLHSLKKPPEDRDRGDIQTLLQLASGNSFLKQLDDFQQEALCKVFGLRSCTSGELVTIQGDKAKSMYVIISGSVNIFVKPVNPKGKDRRTQRPSDGNIADTETEHGASAVEEAYFKERRTATYIRRMAKKFHRKTLLQDKMTGRRHSLARSAISRFRPKNIWDVIDRSRVFGNRVATLISGDAFGEIALKGADSRRTASVAAGGDGCELVVISRADFNRVIKQSNVEYHSRLVQGKLDAALTDSGTHGVGRNNTDALADLVLATMRQIAVFQTMTREEKVSLSKVLKYKQFNAGDNIYSHGDVAEGIYILVEGTVVLIGEAQDLHYATVKSGEVFGFREFTMKSQFVGMSTPRCITAAVRASSARVLFVDVETFSRLWPNQEQLFSLANFIQRWPFMDTSAPRLQVIHDRILLLQDISVLSILAKRKHCIRGEVLVKQGKSAEDLFIIEQGRCELTRSVEGMDRDVPFVTLSDLGVFGGEHRASFSIKVCSPTLDLATISKSDLVHKLGRRVYGKIKRFLSARKVWREKRLNDVIKRNKRFVTATKTAKGKTASKYECYRLRSKDRPPYQFRAKVGSSFAGALVYGKHDNRALSCRKPQPAKPWLISRPKIPRPLSSSGRRTEIQYGNWKSVPFRPLTTASRGFKEVDGGARPASTVPKLIVTKTINPSRPHTAPAKRLRIRKSIPKTTRLRRAIVPSSQQARKQAMAKLEDRLRWIRSQRLKADTALFANH